MNAKQKQELGTVTLSLPESLIARLRNQAATNTRTLSATVRLLLEDALRRVNED